MSSSVGRNASASAAADLFCARHRSSSTTGTDCGQYASRNSLMAAKSASVSGIGGLLAAACRKASGGKTCNPRTRGGWYAERQKKILGAHKHIAGGGEKREGG